MTELSPAAQTVLGAFNERHELCGPFDDDWVELCLAAALEAVADQVVPETATPWNSSLTPLISAKDVRSELLAIAAELRGVRCSMTRALSGDKETACQFLHEAGFIDKEGKLRPPYCSEKL